LEFMADEDASLDEASSFSNDGSASMNDGACFWCGPSKGDFVLLVWAS